MGDGLDIDSIEWIATQEAIGKPISSIALVWNTDDILRSICYSWNGNIFLALNPEYSFRITVACATDVLNIRNSPGLVGSKIGLLGSGEEVAVLGVAEKKEIVNGKEGYWHYIYSQRLQIKGWVFGGYLRYFVN